MKLYKDNIVNLKELHNYQDKEVEINCWIQNKRKGKGLLFLVVRDGFGFAQCVVDEQTVGTEKFEDIKKQGIETPLHIKAAVIKDDKQIGGYELQVSEIHIYTESEEYPITKKAHGVDFLMDKRHLWLRSKRQWAIMRIRNGIIFSIHKFFQEMGFVQMDAPIFTGNAAEGTSTLFETDFFDNPAYLSQSGQLYGEAMAMAMNKIYTFGPTFRAEKSKTRRHLSEFWMIEPEMAFFDNDMNMDLIESFLRFVVTEILNNYKDELNLLERDTTILENIIKQFPRLSYDEAVEIIKGNRNVNGHNVLEILENDLEFHKNRISELSKDIEERELNIKSGLKKGVRKFNEVKIADNKAKIKESEEFLRNIPQWLASAKDFEYGNDFGGSDETVLTRLFDTPIMIYNWPKAIKAFYMKEFEGNSSLVKGVDVLAPEGYGEIVGGGEREYDKEKLISQIHKHNLPISAFEWYLDLRRYGSVPHAGFGLGLERLVSWICKIDHVRESIPFARMMGRLYP